MQRISCWLAVIMLAGTLGFWGGPAGADTETVLYSFNFSADGGNPLASLTMDAQGNLYGTTSGGGSANGSGVVFELSPPYGPNNETVLYSFSGGMDGMFPAAGVIMDKAGNLYGTTYYGGDLSTNFGYGSGVVFKLSPPYGQSNETVLYSFTDGADGGYPDAGVIMDKAGNLYGTTGGGGDESTYQYGYGVVFKLSPPYGQSNETVLYRFSGGTDGAVPAAGVILDKAGNLYGTTVGGGATSSSYPLGAGVVFKVDPAGNETVLHTFTGGADGARPLGGLVQDKHGNLYGTATVGGDLGTNHGQGSGVVFKLNGQGIETVLHTFGAVPDGAFPHSIVMDKKHNLYGTTQFGGAHSNGEVFKIVPSNRRSHETALYSFTGGVDGGGPSAGVLLDKKGNLYGTTLYGGAVQHGNGYGVVFEITP